MGSDERRKYPRLSIQLDVRYKLLEETDDSFKKEITNCLGKGGMFIRSKKPHSLKSRLDMVLTVKNRIITAQGEVRYVIPYNAEVGGLQFPGMGIQFTAIPADDQEFIGEFVEEGLRKVKK